METLDDDSSDRVLARKPEPVHVLSLDRDGWRIIGASVRGADHVSRGTERQDAFGAAIVAGAAIVVVCDGAGSALRAAEGAAKFSASVLEAIVADVEREGFAGFSHDRFRAIVIRGVENCRTAIISAGHPLHEHHATLVALVASPEATFVAHVGDGLAGIAPAAEWLEAALSLPENGVYANETFFVTEEGWADRLRCSSHAALAPGGVAVVMTDGAMPFVISTEQDALEPEFMRPVSRYLFARPGEQAAEALAGTLGSRKANRISSDDKTLVWIGRPAT